MELENYANLDDKHWPFNVRKFLLLFVYLAFVTVFKSNARSKGKRQRWTLVYVDPKCLECLKRKKKCFMDKLRNIYSIVFSILKGQDNVNSVLVAVPKK